MGPMPQYAALVDDHDGSCEGSLVRGNDQPSPEGGPCRPPLGAIASHCPCPLGGGGGGRRPGGVGGLRSKVLHRNGGWKITHLYNLGCFNSILFTHMRVNRVFWKKVYNEGRTSIYH